MPRNTLSEFDKKLREEISNNLKKHTKGLTQAELSDMTGIPTSTLSGYFSKRSTINAGNTQKIADALGINKQDIDPRFKEDFALSHEKKEAETKLINPINFTHNNIKMERVTTADRLKQIMNERNLKQVDILKACQPYCENVKLEKNDLIQYISGKVQPGQDKLTILGKALNVNEVWLMGYNVPSGVKELKLLESTSSKNYDLLELIKKQYGEQTVELLINFQQLDNIDQIKIIERIDMLLENKKYSNKKESFHA